MKKFLAICVLIFIGVIASSGCRDEGQLPVNQTSTAMLALTSTPTLTPTYTTTPTITLTPTSSLTPTSTRTPIPTLSSYKEIDDYVIDLIRTNGGCEFPCILGIEVRKTIWEDVKLVFQPLTSQKIPERRENRYSFYYSHYIEHSGYSWPLIFVGVEGDLHVQDISASFHLDSRDTPTRYRVAIIKNYTLPIVLENLGIPSSVYLRGPAQYERNGGILADMVLIYEDAGVSIEYNMYSFTSNFSRSRGFCFIEDWIDYISLRVISPESGVSLLDDYSKQIKTRYLNNFLSVSELTLEEFYEIGMSIEPDPCFSLINP